MVILHALLSVIVFIKNQITPFTIRRNKAGYAELF